MVEAVAPTRSRRLPMWAIIIALVISAFGGVFVLLWFKLPSWAPGWVVEHSPWVDPIVRVAVEYPDQEYAAFDVLSIDGQSVIPVMGRYLERGDPLTRRFAAWFLRCSEGDAAVEILLPYIQDGDPLVIYHVLGTLEQEDRLVVLQDRRAALVPILIAHLTHGHALVRGQAAKLLGLLKEPAAVDPLLALLRQWDPANDEHGKWISEVITALGEIGDAKAIHPLLLLVDRAAKSNSDDLGVKFTMSVVPACNALAKLPPGPIADVILPLPQEYDRGFWGFEVASGTRDARVITALDEVLRQAEPLEKTEWDRLFVGGRGAMGAYALAKLDHPDARRLLTAALKDPQVLIRQRAVLGIGGTFGHSIDRSLLLAVQEALFDPVDEVRYAAAFSYRFLTKHLSPLPVENQLIEMSHAAAPKQRQAAIMALGHPDLTEAAVLRLIECLNDPDSGVRRAAQGALMKHKSSSTAKAALEAYVEVPAK